MKDHPSYPHLRELMARQVDRRRFIGALGVLGFDFRSVSGDLPHNSNEHLVIPKGYKATRLISWGDRLDNGKTLTFPIQQADDQLQAFGYNNDYIAFHLLETDEKGRSIRGHIAYP